MRTHCKAVFDVIVCGENPMLAGLQSEDVSPEGCPGTFFFIALQMFTNAGPTATSRSSGSLGVVER